MFYGKIPLDIKCLTDSFSVKKAFVMAKASNISYKDYEDVKKICSKELGINKENVFHTTYDSTQAYVFFKPNEIIVAFRGTEIAEIDDWITDLNVATEDTKIGSAHKGFLSGYKLVAGDISARVIPLINQNTKLHICGHSLGGALAMMCALEFYSLGILVSSVYTFGQPRVGKKKFQENFPENLEKRIHRFANDKDVVPRVPPRLMNFRHVGNPRFFTNDGTLHLDKVEWRKYKKQCKQKSKSVIGRLLELVATSGERVTDHSMDDYVGLLKKANL